MGNLCIADDEPIIRKGLVSLPWERAGMTVIAEADNGLAAADVLQTEIVDVLLADIRMPGMDGIQLAKYVSDEGLSTRVVLLSGYGDFAYAQQAISHHVASYLLKPSSPEEILAAVSGAGEEAEKSRTADLRLKMLEAELGKKQLVVDGGGVILGEVPYSGVASQAIEYIVTHFAEPISLSTMSADLHFSSIYLSRVIKRASGHGFLEILSGLRVQEAARRLRDGNLSFTQICERVGAGDARYFGQVFKRAYGVPPSSYRRSPVPPADPEISAFVASLRETIAG